MKLTSDKVREIFIDCLFRENENHDDYISVKGMTMNVGLHPGRVEQHKDEIEELLAGLHPNFRKDVGGGWSFLKWCTDKEGRQWGEHRNGEELMILGMAIKKVDYLFPREMWHNLPGAVPYLIINNN